jgi:hypothetical protein
MSWVAHELSMSQNSLLLISPLRSRLPSLFDELSLGLSINFSGRDALRQEMQICPQPSALAMWLAFSIGQKSALQTRVLTLGLAMDEEDFPVNLSLFPGVSGLILDLSDEISPLWESYFRLKIPEVFAGRPCIALGYPPLNESSEIPHKALQRWLYENFQSPTVIRQPVDLWSEGLEWIFSH